MADDLKKQEAALKELQPLFTQFEKDAAAVKSTAAKLEKSLQAEKDD
jgi:hypothetical protein